MSSRLQSTVLPDSDTIAGVNVTVVEEKDYLGGHLVEVTHDYFAQHENGDVYYFGERVDIYEQGVVASHEGQWLAGEGDNRAGVYMPATPVTGQEYEQEYARDIAEDRFTVLATGLDVTVPAGSYKGCVETNDHSRLDANLSDNKFYCPGVGLVRDESPDGTIELTRFQ